MPSSKEGEFGAEQWKDEWDHKVGLDSGLCQSSGTAPPEVVVMTIVIMRRKLGELGLEESRKDVSSRKCMMQKEGLECGERVSSCHSQQARDTSRVSNKPGAP